MRVQQLVQRLGTPQVALRLQKEELCLSLMAVGRLLGSTSEELMLRQRTTQVLPTCSPRELAMVAAGAPSLGWTQSAFLDSICARAHLYTGDLGIDDAAHILLLYASGRWCSYSATSEHLAFSCHSSLASKRSDVDTPAIALMSAAVLVCTNDHYTKGAPVKSTLPFAVPLIKAVASDIGRLSDLGVATALCGCALLLMSGVPVDKKTLESGCKLLVRRTLEAIKKTETKKYQRLRPSASTRLWAAIVARVVLADIDTSAALLHAIEDDMRTGSIGSLSVDPTANAVGSAAFAYLRAGGLLPEGLMSLPAPLSHPLCVSVINVLLSTSAIESTPDTQSYLANVLQLTADSSSSGSDSIRAALFRTASKVRDHPTPTATDLAAVLEGASRHDVKDVVAEEAVGRLLAAWVADGGPSKDGPSVTQRVHAAVQHLPFPDVRTATAPTEEMGGAVQTMSIPAQMVLRREHGETIKDELLMEVLEDVENYTPAQLAMCIYAIPEKCVEFDMLLERVHSGIPELTIDAVSLLLSACIECRQLSEVLLSDLLAQTAETVTSATTDVHLLIKPLCESLHCSHIEVDQHEDIITFIEAGSANFLGVLSRASASNVCAFLAAFKRAPGLLREAFGPCCAHLCTLVPALDVRECAAIMQAVATVDVVHHRLVDAVSNRLKSLLVQGDVAPADVCAFIDASVELDVPDLDTLLQSSVGSLTQPDVLEELRPALLPSLLKGCVYMRHTSLTQRCVDALATSVDSLRAADVNDVCFLLASNRKVGMSGANFSDLATKIVARCGALLEAGEGGSLNLPAMFGGIRKALSLTGMAADQVRPKPSIPSYLSDAVAERVDQMSGSDVADILSATVFLSLSGLEGLLQATLSRLAADPASCSTTQLSDAIFAAGESGLVGGHVAHHIAVDSLSDYCVDNEHKWRSGSSIARLVYGFSRVQCTKRSLYNVFATRLRIRPILHTLQQADISVVMSGFGNAKYLDKTLFDRLAKKVQDLSPELNAADLTMVLTGYSRMNLLNAPLYERLGERVAEVSADLPPTVSARLLHAYGHVGVKHDNMAGSLLTSMCSKLDALDANKAVEALFALCEMDHEADDAQMDKLAGHIADRIDEVDSNGILQLCDVLQDLNWRHERLLMAVGNQSAELQLTGNNGGITPRASRSVLDTLGSFMIHHPNARQHLTEAARSISRDESVVAELEYNKQQGGQALEE